MKTGRSDLWAPVLKMSELLEDMGRKGLSLLSCGLYFDSMMGHTFLMDGESFIRLSSSCEVLINGCWHRFPYCPKKHLEADNLR